MPKYNAAFWELPMEPEELDKFCVEDMLWHETPAEKQHRYDKEEKLEAILPVLLEIIDNELTPIQRECIKLYFFHKKTQQEVAAILGISRRVVSQHIYGIQRNGKKVGGAINKIRKMCKKRGIDL